MIKSGIYKILNTHTDKFYIGSAMNLHNRLKVHKSNLRLNKHPNKHLQFSFNKHSDTPCNEETKIKISQALRNKEKWPHEDGKRCKCNECVDKTNLMRRERAKYLRNLNPIIIFIPGNVNV